MYGSQLYDLVSRAYQEQLRGGSDILETKQETMTGGNSLNVNVTDKVQEILNINLQNNELEVDNMISKKEFKLGDRFYKEDFDPKG